MKYVVRQGDRIDYNYKEFFVDVETDVATLPLEDACPGSIVYVIETGSVYVLNTKKQWIKQ